MNSFFSASALILLFGCLLIGILYAWLLYHINKNLSKPLQNILGVLRAISVATIAWLLFAPMFKMVSYTLEKPIVIIGQDNSMSVGQITPKGFNKIRYEKDLKSLTNKLASKYEVKVYSFSDSVKAGFNFSNQGKLSNATNFIRKINDELLNRNVGAVILTTDGIFNRGGNPLYEINQLKAPIYAIALGDTIPKRDVVIANVNYNNLVYLDDDFTIEVQTEAYQSKGESVSLSIADNGKNVHQQTISITDNTFSKTIPIKLHAHQVGIQKYTVHLSGLKNEITDKNNTQTFYVEVIDGRQKILLAAAAPHPDLTVLKQAISNNKRFEVKLAMADELNAIDASKFDLVILYQLPSQTISVPSLFQKLQQSKTSVWYILGAQSDLNAFNQTQKLVGLSAANGSLQEVYPNQSKDFAAFSMDEAEKQIFQQFDPLLMPFGRLSISGNSMVMFNQRIGKVDTQSPLLFFMDDNGRKMGYLMGEGLWRWKLNEANANVSLLIVEDLIQKTVQYLSVKDDKRKFKAFPAKTAFNEQENILFNANLYNDSFEPINEPDISLQIKNAAGKTYNYLFSKTDNTYRLDVGTLPNGNYTYVASANFGGKKYLATGGFYVNALIAEFQQTTANHQLLNAMAKQSNGKLFMPNNLLRIADEIENNDNVKTISYEDRSYEELINFKWVFVLILLLLSIEWFLRKRSGEI